MQDTISDCWSLIYDHNCNSVVILAKPEDNSVINLNFFLLLCMIEISFRFELENSEEKFYH